MNTKMTFSGLSQAAENNKGVILEKLKDFFTREGIVLEIGSGTGQHAAHLAANLPHLTWQPTDRGDYLPVLIENLVEMKPSNVCQPRSLDVEDETWVLDEADYVFSANTLHIMSADHVEHFMRGVGRVLKPDGLLVVYGPFKYNGEFTTASNARFDRWLKDRDELSGVRDIDTIEQLALDNGLSFRHDFLMPANNQLLVFRKQLSS